MVFEVDHIYLHDFIKNAQNCALWNTMGVSDIGRSEQGHFLRQKVSNSENKELVIVPWYSKKEKSKRTLKIFL